MAMKTVVTLVDDLDGTEADTTIAFAFDGVSYSIDLTGENAEKLRAAVEPWISATTRTGGRRTAAPRAGSKREDLSEIRSWARDHGFKVSDRGRVSEEIRNAYATAH